MRTSIDSPPSRLTRTHVAQGILTLLFALCGLIAVSTAFAPDPFDPAAVVLIASFGILAGVLGIAAAWTATRSRLCRVALWSLPLFFVWHVAALGTWMPDAVLAALSVIALLLLRAKPE